KTKLVWGIGASVVVLCLAALGYFWLRKSKTARHTRSADMNPATGMIDFSCSACGKSLKAKESLAGKRIKCPTCGKGVVVAAAATATSSARSDKGARPRRRAVLLSVGLLLAVAAAASSFLVLRLTRNHRAHAAQRVAQAAPSLTEGIYYQL